MEPTNELATSDMVRNLASYAALPLAAGREIAVAEVLGAWLPDANDLSAKMSDSAYQTLVPATVFVHPEAREGET